MKIYIKSNKDMKPIPFLDIVVSFPDFDPYLTACGTVRAAETLPTTKAGMERLSRQDYNQKMDDYNDFVDDIRSLLYTLKFEIREDYDSNVSNSASHYIEFFPTDHELVVCYELFYFMRISNHSRQSETANPFPAFYESEADKHKTPKHKKVQHKKHLDILVGDDHYDNYEDAYDAVRKKIERVQALADKNNRQF